MEASSRLHLGDGAQEVRLAAAPHAREVLLQAAEALRGEEVRRLPPTLQFRSICSVFSAVRRWRHI